MKAPTAPLPESILSAIILAPFVKLMLVSAAEVAVLLEFISKPTTWLASIAVKCAALSLAVTVLPEILTFAFWIKYLLNKS